MQNTDENTNDILNFLDDEEDLFDPNIEDELATCSFNEHIHETYFDAIKQFATKTKFKFMHLNINSLHSKIDEIDKILKLKKFDIVFINETKFDKHKPIGFYKSSHYDIIRRDRDFNDDLIGNKGGGIIIFVKKHYKVKFIKAPDMEFIYMNVMVGKQQLNFISAYKPPKTNNFQFLTNLENFFIGQNLSLPLFIVGDLNLDLLKTEKNEYVNDRGLQQQQLLSNYNLKNYVQGITRIGHYKNQKTGVIRTSESSIDVILHNGDLLCDSTIIGCPYSDHKFVLATINIQPMTKNCFETLSRNTSKNNMTKILDAISKVDFKFITEFQDVNTKLMAFSDILLCVLDHIAPLKNIKVKDKEDQTPWVDLELAILKNKRDIYYSLWCESFNNDQMSAKTRAFHETYSEYKASYQSTYRNKMTDFFKQKLLKISNLPKIISVFIQLM